MNAMKLFEVALKHKEYACLAFILDEYYAEWVEGNMESGLRMFNAGLSRLSLFEHEQYASMSSWKEYMTKLYDQRVESELNGFENQSTEM
jgi:hypothetical protein